MRIVTSRAHTRGIAGNLCQNQQVTDNKSVTGKKAVPLSCKPLRNNYLVLCHSQVLCYQYLAVILLCKLLRRSSTDQVEPQFVGPATQQIALVPPLPSLPASLSLDWMVDRGSRSVWPVIQLPGHVDDAQKSGSPLCLGAGRGQGHGKKVDLAPFEGVYLGDNDIYR